MEHMIVASLRGTTSRNVEAGVVSQPSELELQIADTLEHVWFALRVGWSGGRHSQAAIIDKPSISTQ